MNIKEIQEQCVADSEEWWPSARSDFAYKFLCLAGETGEACNVWKKHLRGSINESTAVELLKGELADVLTYLCELAGQLGIDLEEAYKVKREFNAERFA
jgi:NTP pyrophosphatase (non-canonical NTP hydrolase)